jgi:hypothetical protein
MENIEEILSLYTILVVYGDSLVSICRGSCGGSIFSISFHYILSYFPYLFTILGWIVKWYGKYGRKVSLNVKWYGKYERKKQVK